VAGETLTKDEVCRRLGVTGKVLDGMIRRKEFPRGFKPSPKSRPVWPLTVIEAWFVVLPWLTGEVEDGEDGGEDGGEDEDS
jgi:predicted DNA-binding transcriptional regulator AlpA